MSDEPVVVVRGEAFAEVDPEIAGFSVTVGARDRSRDEVLRRLASRQEWVRQLLDTYADAVEKRETSAVQVYPETKGRASGEKVTAHTGSLTTTVMVADFGRLGEMIIALAGQDQVTISGPWWGLRPGSPIHREVREQAIRAAIERGREYADALGARVTGLEKLADLHSTGDRPVLMGGKVVSLGFSANSQSPPQLDLEPQRQEARASVEARFRISPPSVLAAPED